jgi:hypothetical protein
MAALLLAACCPRPRGFEGINDDDRIFIALVRRVAAAHPRPEDVEAMVGYPALVNTTRTHSVEKLGTKGGISPDELAPSECVHLEDDLHVVMWERPVHTRDPYVVGIQWPRSGPPTVFFGMLPTPE